MTIQIVVGVNGMNAFDSSILHFLNRFAQSSWLFDKSVAFVSNNLLRGAVITASFWWIWFRSGETQSRDREFVLSGFVASFVALPIARALALVLPFRQRPLMDPALGFRLPFGSDESPIVHWSSFPSDHAVLYFSLATCLYFVSRRIGLLAYFYALFVVCVPRIYMGVHYPTDILAGGLLGIGIGGLSCMNGLRESISRPLFRWLEKDPASFYLCFYLCSFLFATQFDPVRTAVGFAWNGIMGGGRNLPW